MASEVTCLRGGGGLPFDLLHGQVDHRHHRQQSDASRADLARLAFLHLQQPYIGGGGGGGGDGGSGDGGDLRRSRIACSEGHASQHSSHRPSQHYQIRQHQQLLLQQQQQQHQQRLFQQQQQQQQHLPHQRWLQMTAAAASAVGSSLSATCDDGSVSPRQQQDNKRKLFTIDAILGRDQRTRQDQGPSPLEHPTRTDDDENSSDAGACGGGVVADRLTDADVVVYNVGGSKSTQEDLGEQREERTKVFDDGDGAVDTSGGAQARPADDVRRPTAAAVCGLTYSSSGQLSGAAAALRCSEGSTMMTRLYDSGW